MHVKEYGDLVKMYLGTFTLKQSSPFLINSIDLIESICISEVNMHGKRLQVKLKTSKKINNILFQLYLQIMPLTVCVFLLGK